MYLRLLLSQNSMENTAPLVPPNFSTAPAAPTLASHHYLRIIVQAALVIVALIAVGAGVLAMREYVPSSGSTASSTPNATGLPSLNGNASIPFEESLITIAPAVSQNFSMSEIKNVAEMEKAYGVKFSQSDLDQLDKNKFIIKSLMDTNLTPVAVGDKDREFVSLYYDVMGSRDYKERTQANAVFITSDVLMNLFSILSVDLLKETENKYLYPQVLSTTQKLYSDASAKLQGSKTDKERREWTKVRNYFAIPYAFLSTMMKPVTAEDYWNSHKSVSVDEMQVQYQQKDKTADSYEKTAAFVKSLKLDSDSEAKVLVDIKSIYDAPEKSLPKIFQEEYEAIAGDIQFSIPFSLFKVRGSYTSSSLRRQYFRAVQWYQQIPFFTKSPDLTTYAVNMGVLMKDNPDLLQKYDSMSSLLGALVGNSDDLDVKDYAQAVTDLGASTSDSQKLNTFLDSRKPQSKIKSMPAFYPSVGQVSIDDVIQATRGMRFFSQKFIPDSYWTGKLTQGDEKPAVNGMQLPRNASSLEVMTLLGSAYAQSQLPKLSFYPTHKQAIDTRLGELKTEATGWGGSYWQSNQVTSILWTISGLFEWFQQNRASAPQFMQSPLWDAKTLLTGSAFWTELRHTNILYAKQSFAEKGGGGDDQCDIRKIPPPAQGYVEPQPEAYDRLQYAARLLHEEYKARGLELKNLKNLEEYVDLVNIVREYTKLQLENTAYSEPTMAKKTPIYNDPNCVQNYISPDVSIKRDDYPFAYNANDEWVSALSRSEELRMGIISRMETILPSPVEGPILPIKDKRTAVVADVHTSDEGILEEGTGVPRVIFVAVKDANGTRLTVGFTYSHYELLSPTRLTDEEWQTRFYTEEGGDYEITYKPKAAWPTLPVWYQQLLGTK